MNVHVCTQLESHVKACKSDPSGLLAMLLPQLRGVLTVTDDSSDCSPASASGGEASPAAAHGGEGNTEECSVMPEDVSVRVEASPNPVAVTP